MYQLGCGSNHSEDPLYRWDNNIKWILKLLGVGWGCGLNSSLSGYKLVVSSCEHSDEPSDSIKCWEFLE
jgi:hypothetical protein